MSPSCVGMGPVSWLSRSHRLSRLVRLPSCVGMGPVSRLSWSWRFSRSARLPSCVGIEPVSWLKRSNRALRAERFPICVGIVPLMLYSELRDCLLRFIIETRLDATVMPAQVSIFSEVLVPQVLRGWSALRLSLATFAAQ